ncbi:hypothetical protein FHR32_006450 [Streptosporangium album]|uniref:Uncharacterized protein n=1 Tax=Streptosporangium album TaxID=47479 RepID=A0A7W7S190_9ACTN|nr:hypothetical protein [Streptosporangium album]MBB4942064.1 hypothetical protein [Streptosporangium album]
MGWIFAAVALAFMGLLVLGVLGFRVLLAARELGKEVERTSRRLEPARVLSGRGAGTIHDPKG